MSTTEIKICNLLKKHRRSYVVNSWEKMGFNLDTSCVMNALHSMLYEGLNSLDYYSTLVAIQYLEPYMKEETRDYFLPILPWHCYADVEDDEE